MSSLPTHSPMNVAALDARDPNAGGASHLYGISTNPQTNIQFQHGARNAEGSTPGVFDDDLLAIVEDRLSAFQNGSFACDENAAALRHIQHARAELARRVAARMAQGVLGQNKKHD